MEISAEYSERLIATLLKQHRQYCALSDDVWALSAEHFIYVIEQDLKCLTGICKTYRQYLYEHGLSKNSYSVADGMRYLSSFEYSTDPDLFDAVIRGAITPVLTRYNNEFQSHQTANNTGSFTFDFTDWVRKRLVQLAGLGIAPSPYGNVLMREANAILFERTLSAVCPKTFDTCKLHYEQFLTSIDLSGGFVRDKWELGFSFFDMNSMFGDHWATYLSSVASRLELESYSGNSDDLANAWLAVMDLSCK